MLWGGRAVHYGSDLAATASTNWVRTASLRRLRKLVGKSHRVLEVGCGNASSLLGPLSEYSLAYGADVTEEMLLMAKQHHKNIRGLFRSDACSLPFADASFDLVYSSRCLINVLDSGMQQAAIAEMLRVAKPNGTVVLIENFEEPVARMNAARKSYKAGAPIIETYNLRLNLETTLGCARKHGWDASSIRGNTLGSFVANVIVAGITREKGSRLVEQLLHPLYVLLGRIEDYLGKHLPLFGKDTMVVFKKSPA
jgi:SAM-dependent methyltransferase